MLNQPKAIVPQDLVLIHVEHKPAFFARVEDINPDMKRGWWQVKLFMLALPLKVVTWIIDEEQIRGAEFTMGGAPIRIERIAPPVEAKPEIAEPTDHSVETPSQGQKQARILSFKPKA